MIHLWPANGTIPTTTATPFSKTVNLLFLLCSFSMERESRSAAFSTLYRCTVLQVEELSYRFLAVTLYGIDASHHAHMIHKYNSKYMYRLDTHIFTKNRNRTLMFI